MNTAMIIVLALVLLLGPIIAIAWWRLADRFASRSPDQPDPNDPPKATVIRVDPPDRD